MPGEATAVDVDGVRRGGAICSSSGTSPARPHREAPVRPLPPDDEGHQTPPSMPPTLRGRPRLPPSVATPRARVRVRANCSARRTRPSPPDRSRETTRAAGDPTVRRRRPRTPDDGGGRRPPSHARRDPRRASARATPPPASPRPPAPVTSQHEGLAPVEKCRHPKEKWRIISPDHHSLRIVASSTKFRREQSLDESLFLSTYSGFASVGAKLALVGGASH